MGIVVLVSYPVVLVELHIGSVGIPFRPSYTGSWEPA